MYFVGFALLLSQIGKLIEYENIYTYKKPKL